MSKPTIGEIEAEERKRYVMSHGNGSRLNNFNLSSPRTTGFQHQITFEKPILWKLLEIEVEVKHCLKSKSSFHFTAILQKIVLNCTYENAEKLIENLCHFQKTLRS